MLGALARVRPEDRRATWAAFATLFGFMAGHAQLETARDALFLAKIPATELPRVYLAVAAIALLVTFINRRRQRVGSPRASVALLLATAAGTAALRWLLEASGGWVLYALYVWSALIATVVLAQLWLLFAGLFTATRAKSAFAVIGAGSVTGAIAGTGAAGVLTELMAAEQLVVAASATFALTAAGPLWLREQAPRGRRRDKPDPVAATPFSEPYPRRVLLLVLVSTVALTLGDFVFKDVVARNVAAPELGSFFARVYFVLNVLSLGAQLLLAEPLVRRWGVSGALVVLPALLVLSGAGIAATGAVAAAVALKGVDGSLRYSLHKTASELLFVPMGERVRGVPPALPQRRGARQSLRVRRREGAATTRGVGRNPRHGGAGRYPAVQGDVGRFLLPRASRPDSPALGLGAGLPEHASVAQAPALCIRSRARAWASTRPTSSAHASSARSAHADFQRTHFRRRTGVELHPLVRSFNALAWPDIAICPLASIANAIARFRISISS